MKRLGDILTTILKQSKHCKLIVINESEAEEMGILEHLEGHKPVDNDAQKRLKGDCVAKIDAIKLTKVKENGVLTDEDRIIVECSAINVIKRNNKVDDNIIFGDKLTKFYKESGGKKTDIKAFENDMFTAGVAIDKSSQEAFELSLTDAVGSLVYFSCWLSTFQGNDGSDVEYNTMMIRSKKKLTPANSIPEVPL